MNNDELTGIDMTASTLAKISGMSLEQWGLDEGSTVVVYPDRINATTESGMLIADIAAGNDDLEQRVWAAAMNWANT